MSVKALVWFQLLLSIQVSGGGAGFCGVLAQPLTINIARAISRTRVTSHRNDSDGILFSNRRMGWRYTGHDWGSKTAFTP